MVTADSLVPIKALFPIIVNFDSASNVSDVSDTNVDTQYSDENALLPIEVTDAGMVTSVSCVPSNALSQ